MVQIISKNSYHMYKLNQMLTTSKKLIARSSRKFLTFLTKKITKIALPFSSTIELLSTDCGMILY